MKRYLLVLLIFLGVVQIDAQESAFETLFPTDIFPESSFKTYCIETSDGGFIVNPSVGYTLWKISADGELLSELTMDSSIVNRTYFCALLDIADDPDHHLAIALPIDWTTETGNVLYALKIDDNLNYIPSETRVLDFSEDVKLILRGFPKEPRFNLEEDGSISFATKAQRYDNTEGLLLARMSPEGEKTVGFFDDFCNSDYSYLSWFIPSGENYHMIAKRNGYLNYYEISRELDGIDSIFCLVHRYLDYSPLVFWEGGSQYLAFASLQEHYNTPTKLSDSGFVFPASVEIMNGPTKDFPCGMGLWKIDGDFNILSHAVTMGNRKYYPYCHNPVLFNGEYLYYCFTEETNNWYQPHRTVVCKFDTNLNLIWQRWYGEETGWYWVTHMALTSDGGALLSGIGNPNSNYINNNRYAYILKITSDGYCSIPENQPLLKPYDCYPNPVEDILQVEYSPDVNPKAVELYDLQGRLIRTQQNDLENVNMENLPAGTYTLRVILEGGIDYTDKVIKTQ